MTDWRDRAACAEVPGDLFFPPPYSGALNAKSICERCPVATQCLEYALNNGEEHGVWGGLTENERKTLLRRARA